MNRHSQRPGDPSLPAVFKCEPLEARTLLSAELLLSSLFTREGVYEAGERIDMQAILVNMGLHAVGPGTPARIEVRLSSDLVWGNEDDLLVTSYVKSDGIDAGLSVEELLITGHVPLDTPKGHYFIAAKLDADDLVSEPNEKNNYYWSSRAGVSVGYLPSDPEVIRQSVQVRLSGPGSGMIQFAQEYLPRKLKSGEWIIGHGHISSISVVGTTPASRLEIKTADGVWTRVDMITVDGSLKHLLAPTTELTGNVQIDGSLGKLVLGGVSSYQQQTITLGPAARPAAISLGSVLNLSIISAAPIGMLSASQWLDAEYDQSIIPDRLAAPQLDKLLVTGDRRQAIAGDFMAVVELTSQSSASLRQAKIAGNLVDGITTPGGIGTLRVGQDITDCRIEAGCIKSVRVAGDMLSSDLLVGQLSQAPGRSGLRQLVVGGWMTGSTLDSQCGVGLVSAGGMDSCSLYVGNLLSWGQLTGLPRQDVMATFDQRARLSALRVGGHGAAGSGPRFINTSVAAGAIGSARLSGLEASAPQPFGLTADTVATLHVWRDGWRTYRGLSRPQQSMQLDAMTVRIV